MGNIIFNFDGYDPTDEEMEIIERSTVEKFTDPENAGRIVVAFNRDKETGIRIERIPEDSFDEKYKALAESTRENLFIAMRAIPVLFGLTVQTGFNTQEYEEAFMLYNRTAVIPKQNEITTVFNKLFNTTQSVIFTPFSLTGQEANDDNIMTNPEVLKDIPTELLSDLTTNERRELLGYEAVNEPDANESILADRLGVGGTQSLVEVLKDTEMSDETKRGVLSVVFGLTTEQVNNIIKTNGTGTIG